MWSTDTIWELRRMNQPLQKCEICLFTYENIAHQNFFYIWTGCLYKWLIFFTYESNCACDWISFKNCFAGDSLFSHYKTELHITEQVFWIVIIYGGNASSHPGHCRGSPWARHRPLTLLAPWHVWLPLRSSPLCCMCVFVCAQLCVMWVEKRISQFGIKIVYKKNEWKCPHNKFTCESQICICVKRLTQDKNFKMWKNCIFSVQKK